MAQTTEQLSVLTNLLPLKYIRYYGALSNDFTHFNPGKALIVFSLLVTNFYSNFLSLWTKLYGCVQLKVYTQTLVISI